MIAGFLGMSTKFAECVVGDQVSQDQSRWQYLRGPMYYLEQGLKKRSSLVGQTQRDIFMLSIVIGCMGIGNMFQSTRRSSSLS